MNIGEIITADCANGIGIRLSLFVSGCTNHCKDCFQPQTWDFHYGQPYTSETENYILTEISKPQYDGITILGGEPFEFSNQETLRTLIQRIKNELPNKTIWMYTGFVYDRDLIADGRRHCSETDFILNNIDILVDGPFETENKDIRLNFRGSTNQRIIDMKTTRETGIVTLSKYHEKI